MRRDNNRVMKDWKVFTTVVEERSFTISAKKLYCSIAMISKSITRLEDILGVVLLNRNAHRFEITNAGRVTYDRAREIQGIYKKLFHEVSNDGNKIKGSVRLSVPSLLCEFAASEWVYTYMNKNKEVSVQVISRDRTELTLAYPEFDDLVLKSGYINSPDLIHSELGTMKFSICASPEYILKYGEIITPEDLHHHWIMKVEHPFLSYPLSAVKDEQEVKIDASNDKTLKTNNITSLLNLTISGLGVCIALPEWLVSKYVAEKKLVRVLPEWQLPELPMYLVWRYRENYSKLFSDFKSYIEIKWSELR